MKLESTQSFLENFVDISAVDDYFWCESLALIDQRDKAVRLQVINIINSLIKECEKEIKSQVCSSVGADCVAQKKILERLINKINDLQKL